MPEAPQPATSEHARLLATQSQQAEANGGSESDLRHHLWLFFHPWATSGLGLDQSALSQEGTGLSGRYDSRIGRAIIEYKVPGSLASVSAQEEAAEQALKYVNDPTMAADVVVVTDGTTWAHYRDESAGPEPGEQMTLELGLAGPAPIPRQRFTWRDNSPESCEHILNLIATVRTDPVTSQVVAQKLGPNRQEVLDLIAAIADAVRNREADDRVDILFRQWIQLAGVSYGITSPKDPWPKKRDSRSLLGPKLAPALHESTYAEALFALHTYVAFSAKVIGTELLSLATGDQDKRPTNWVSLPGDAFTARLRALEDGTISMELRSPGLLAGDLFGWYAVVATSDHQLATRLRGVLAVLGEIAWARVTNSARGIAGDLLRDFYAAVVPNALRRALGEFFTPQWLAERTIISALQLAGKENQSTSFLDPSCGSGTFLVAALARELVIQDQLHPSDTGVATRNALELTVGFDINPVAVLMSRINLLLALGDRIESLSVVTPRVYQADSILLPDRVIGQATLEEQNDFRRLPLAIDNIDVPASIATLDGLHILRENIETAIENGRTTSTFRTRLRVDLKRIELEREEADAVLDAAQVIFGRIAKLKAEGRNGVWARIIEQAFAPATLEPVDIVAGNPPWINWKHLPDAWQERSQPVWDSWGLWATKQRGGGIPLADIATLLFARSVVTYAGDGAVVAFLLPESFLISDPGNERIRLCRLGHPGSPNAPVRFRPLAVDDWTSIKPFSPDAANLPIGLYVRAAEGPSWPIPKTVWRRAKSRTRLDRSQHWGEIAPQLRSAQHDIRPVEQHNTGSPWVRTTGIKLLNKGAPISYTWGQGFHTRGADGLYTYEILSGSPDPDGLVLVRNVPSVGPNTRDETPREGLVEAEFLWPLVRGQDVQRFNIDSSGLYALLPHHPDEPNRFLTIEELIEFAPRLFDYLEPWRSRLAARSPYGKLQPSEEKPFGVLGPTERLSRTSTLVLCRYMHPEKHPPAAVAKPQWDPKLGRTTTCYANNKSNVHITNSTQEAHYLAGWMNSLPAQEAIARLASSTTIGPTTLHRLPIAKFDLSDETHSEIGQIALSAEEGQSIDWDHLATLVADAALKK